MANLIARVISWLHPMSECSRITDSVFGFYGNIEPRGMGELEPMLSQSQINDIVNILEKFR